MKVELERFGETDSHGKTWTERWACRQIKESE